ncbi:MAG: hypothetical protein EKK53_09710 [Burkholderiales bacterium]|nr:MAG: hypothetical protein EKK53_09710 [Burkholderiales bacterium]
MQAALHRASRAYRSVHPAARLLTPLTAALIALAAPPCALAATAPAATEATPPSFALPARPSEMLRAPETTWAPVMAGVASAMDERAKALDLLSKPALIEYQTQRTVFAQARRDWPAVFDAVRKTRELQESESARHMAGLLNEVLARHAQAGGDAAALTRLLRDQVLAMPWTAVEPAVLTLRDQLAGMKVEAVDNFVVNRLDLSASVSDNKATVGFLIQLLAMRFQVLEVLPKRDALVAALDDAIAQRKAEPAAAARQ